MTRVDFLIEARKRLRAKFDRNSDAAAAMNMSAAHLSNVLSGKIDAIPESLLKMVGYKLCEEEYKRAKS